MIIYLITMRQIFFVFVKNIDFIVVNTIIHFVDDHFFGVDFYSVLFNNNRIFQHFYDIFHKINSIRIVQPKRSIFSGLTTNYISNCRLHNAAFPKTIRSEIHWIDSVMSNSVILINRALMGPSFRS